MDHFNQIARTAVCLILLGVAEIARAEAKDYGDVTAATPVTLKFDNSPQKAVFDELAKQVGVQFMTLPGNLWEKTPGAAISVNSEAQPFWLGMKDACGKAGISLKYATDTSEPKIILNRDNQEWTNFPMVNSGPFLVSLIGLHRSSTVDMRKPGEIQKSFFAKFTVFCEPRFRLLRGSIAAKVEEAVDENGKSLIPKDAAEPTMTFVSTWVHNIEGKLEYPKEAGAKIAKLRASAKFVAQVKSETIEVTDPLTSKNITKVVAGRKITIKEVRRGAEEYEASVTFGRGELSAAQFEAALFPGNALRLVDAEGKSVIARGFGLGTKGDEASYLFKFEKEPPKGSRIGKPIKLAWEIPTETKDLSVVFEFKDLPLP